MRKALSITVLIAAFGILIWTVYPHIDSVVQTEEVLSSLGTPIPKTSSLVVDFANSEDLEFNDINVQDETAYSILEKNLNENGVNLETENYDFGVFVKSINGEESNADMSWIYFVNGDGGNVAADQYQLSDGDQVLWKYTKVEY